MILEMVEKNNGVITSAEVTKAGISRGVYQLAEIWDDEMYQLQIRYKKGIFSGETALFFSDLTDRTPMRFQITFPLKYNVSVLKKENVNYNRTKPEWYEKDVIN